jgi:RNA polymerase sigma factor (sigma-70 family)
MDATLDQADHVPVRALAGGDEPIARVFASQYRRLRAFVRAQIGDTGDVEDIVQEVFYELVAAYRVMQPIGHLAAWLLRVARNRVIDRLRARGREREVMVRSLDAATTYPESDRLLETLALPDDSGPEADYARAALADALEVALAELPSEQREVFVAHEIEGRSFKQLAASTGININTLLGRKHAAIRHLRERMRDAVEDLT